MRRGKKLFAEKLIRGRGVLKRSDRVANSSVAWLCARHWNCGIRLEPGEKIKWSQLRKKSCALSFICWVVGVGGRVALERDILLVARVCVMSLGRCWICGTSRACAPGEITGKVFQDVNFWTHFSRMLWTQLYLVPSLRYYCVAVIFVSADLTLFLLILVNTKRWWMNWLEQRLKFNMGSLISEPCSGCIEIITFWKA